MQLSISMKLKMLKVLEIISLTIIVSLMGCASEPFVTDEGSAAAQHADRQNIEFQEEGVPRKEPDLLRQ
jgi:hypothetical protein